MLVHARRLARAGRIDAAIEAYESWLLDAPGDATAWRELAAQRRRAGRLREGIAGLERAQALRPEAAVARQIRQWRAETSTSLEPMILRTRDSDGTGTVRTSLGVGVAEMWRGRLTASGSHRRTTDGLIPAVVDEGRLTAAWRPRATLRIELTTGVARTGIPVADTIPAIAPQTGAGGGRGRGGGGSGATTPGVPGIIEINNVAATIPTGGGRIRWSTPGRGANLDLRVGRTLLDISPLLVRNRVVRDEIAVRTEIPAPAGLRLRALGRVGSVTSTLDRNTRTMLGGAVVRRVGDWGEVATSAQQFMHARPARSGYFAPRVARMVEVGTYVERETERGLTLVVDGGLGLQQVREHGAELGSWQPSFRGTANLTFPLGPGRSIQVEVDGFDGRIGSDAATVGRWRYGATLLGLRWSL